MPAESITRAFSTNDMLPLTSEGNVQHCLNILKDTNMYEKFGMHMSEYFTETIYMHQFHFCGLHSDWYNRYILAYLLVMESILDNKYKWQRIDLHMYYCRIEYYHVYLWRYKW